MRHTLKQCKISHLWQFMLVLVLSTLSCETEQLDPQIIEDADQSSRLIYQKKTTSDVLSNPQLFTQIQKINAAKPSLYSKNQDINNTIVIDIKNANYAEKANGHSYTFPIVSDDPGAKLTNVVFNYNKAGEYIPVLVNYPFTYGEMQRMTKKALDALPVEIQLLDPEHITTNQSKNFGYTCFNNYTLVCEQGLPEYCNGTDAEWILESVECYNTGPGPDSGFPFNGGGGFESVTIPINVNINYAHVINLIVGQHNFTQEEKDWLNDPVNDIKVENIFNNILVAGEHTDDVRDLAVQVVKYIVSNKGANEAIAVKHVDQIASLLKENNFTDEGITTSKITIEVLSANRLNGPYDQTYYQSLNQYFEVNTIDPIFQAYFTTQCIIARLSFTPEEQEWCNKNPTLCDLKVYWLASKEMIQIGLDIGGAVPVIGEVCDITNGIIYAIDGDAVNASFSFGAAIPIAGWFATGAKMAYKTASNIASKQVLKWFVKTNGIITFGKSGQLKKVMGIPSGSGTHAHHIIPFAKSENRLVQLAAKSGEAFHINDIINGVEVAAWRNTNHPTYSNRIVELMEEAWTPNMTPNQAYEALMDIVSDIKQVIQNNPNVKLNDLDF